MNIHSKPESSVFKTSYSLGSSLCKASGVSFPWWIFLPPCLATLFRMTWCRRKTKGKGKNREMGLGLNLHRCLQQLLPSGAQCPLFCPAQRANGWPSGYQWKLLWCQVVTSGWHLKNLTALAIYLAHTDQNKNHVENRAIGDVGAQIEYNYLSWPYKVPFFWMAACHQSHPCS